jgi:hypothetical protein
MVFQVWTSIKRWWRNHRWVNVRDNYIIPHRNTTFWLNDYEMEQVRKFKKDNPSNSYQYCFTPGPIGVCTRIKGGEKEQDITDYNTW